MAQTAALPSFILLLGSAAGYVGLGYFTERANFTLLLVLFALNFAAYVGLMQRNLPLKIALFAAISFRVLLLLAQPELSDDYFRFIWDGRLLAAGENPFLQLPTHYIATSKQVPGINLELFKKLNSPHYFSVYPPVCQFVFTASAWLFPAGNEGMVRSMRLIILAAELGNIFLIFKLLQHYQKPVRQVLWYALNPLVIVELTGNLHFEALLIFFLLGGMYLLTHNKVFLSGLTFGLAIGVKMIPLLFMPFLLVRLGWKKFLIFGSATGLSLAILFWPFLSAELFQNIWQSLDLYFQKFEFNASIYYVFRWLGFIFHDYNQIAVIGPGLSLITFLAIMFAAYQSRKSPHFMLPAFFLLALSIYYFLATTVHPWYLTTLAALCVFTPYRYALVWTGAAVLSYATYQTRSYHENLFLTALEYCLVFGWLLIEIRKQRRSIENQISK